MRNARERILEASFGLFRRQGLTGTGIKQILEAAGAPYGSLYHHFPGGKDELAAKTIERAGVHYGLVVLGVLEAHPDDPVEAVRATFADAARELEESGWADACPVETVALEVASTNEPLRQATAAVFTLWLDGLRDWLVAAGVPRDGAGELADTILAALEGAFVLARSLQSTRPLLSCGDAMAELTSAALADGPARGGRRRRSHRMSGLAFGPDRRSAPEEPR